MATPSQNRASYLNTERHRTPRILRVENVTPGSDMAIIFDRDMDTSALSSNFRIRLFDPAGDQWYEFGPEDGGFLNARTLYVQTPVASGAYDGDELFVRYMSGNVKAKGRAYPLLIGERCDRVELA